MIHHIVARGLPARLLLALLFILMSTEPCAGQRLGIALRSVGDTAEAAPRAPKPRSPPTNSYVIRWREAAAVGAVVSLLMADDRSLRNAVQGNSGGGADDVATAFRQAGDVKVYGALTLVTVGTGLLTRNRGIARTGTQLAAAGAIAGVSTELLKFAVGRSRPDARHGAYDFHPFSNGASFPSGHSALAFALATTLGDASHSTWMSAGLYVIATGTAWSRLHDERHWPSDVLMGAAVGVTSAKLINGHWRIFGLRSPRFLVTPQGPGLQMTF